MSAVARRTRAGIVAALVSSIPMSHIAGGQEPELPLHARGTVESLGAPESRAKGPAGDALVFNVSDPSLQLFRPAPGKANGTAVIIAPGGGFVALAIDNEGAAVARRLARLGVTALVLKYRTIRSTGDPAQLPEAHLHEMETLMARVKSGLPKEMPPFAGEPRAVEDGARALAIVREQASGWGIDPKRVGIIGFSAGAYLAADLAIGDKSSRPDFVGLVYGGLRTPVPADASPAFIAAAADDEFQPADASLLFAAWRAAGAPAELHIYERGGHGFGLSAQGTTSDHWFEEFIWWLGARGLMDAPPAPDSTKPH